MLRMLRWREWSTLQVALLFSVAVHAALLTIRFVDPQAMDRLWREEPLEVILVNARSEEAPAKAQAVAQARLAGGGDAAQGRATSPLPPTTVDMVGEDAETQQQRIEQLQQTQAQLLAHLRSELALLQTREAREAANPEETREQEERRRQMSRLLAEIEKRIHEENARPKRRYVSPATREEAYARYYDALRRRIEARGTRDFPQSQGRKLYGELMMNVTIDAEGQVVSADVVRSSGNAVLDKRAMAIVRAAAPYGRFTEAMRRQADQIVVTSRFRFTREDGLETSLSGP